MATEPFAQGLYPLFTTQFTTVLELKLQQMGSLLRGRVDSRQYVGKMASPVQQLNATVAKAPAGRFAPLEISDSGFTRRWVFPSEREWAVLIDSFDELQTIVDPKSQYSDNAAMALGRSVDDIIIAAAIGTAQTGQDASNLAPENFNAGTTVGNTGFQVVEGFGASGNVGLTIDKMIELRRSLRHYHVDLDRDPVTLLIGSQQEADLLSQVQVTSSEFTKQGGVLEDGKVTRFLGFDLVVTERLPYTSTTRTCVAFARSGMHLGVWRDMNNYIDIIPTRSGRPFQVYASMMIGATRTQPGKVFEVTCLDNSGTGDITP
jgi:hypothetical protein